MKLSEAERIAYSRYSDDLHYQASMVESSYGLGKLDGREEGREEGIAKVALNLLQMGQPIEDVSKATGLTLKALEKLRDSDIFRVKEPVAAYKTTKRKTAPKAANKVSK